ncbi:MAG: iron-containing alcohol dehydrogenase, partial [Clostridiales bacterium]|nr:iron-containing alcohol dehydrogenase [Clostridiales bacterium]
MSLAEPHTKTIEIGNGAIEKAHRYLSEEFSGTTGVAVCDGNTEFIARKAFPDLDRYVFAAGTHAYDDLGDELAGYIREKGHGYAVAVGSGSVTDLTRYAAHSAGIPFISCPTAASVDGFVSSVAAMTINKRKATLPSTPPIALFADPESYMTAPRRLTVSGVCDILGKYISI